MEQPTPDSTKVFEAFIDQSQFGPESPPDVEMSLTQEQLESLTISQSHTLRTQTPPPPMYPSLPIRPHIEPDVGNAIREDPMPTPEEDVFMDISPAPSLSRRVHTTGSLLVNSSGESEVKGEDDDVDGEDGDEQEQPRRSQRISGKQKQQLQIESDEDEEENEGEDMDEDEEEENQVEDVGRSQKASGKQKQLSRIESEDEDEDQGEKKEGQGVGTKDEDVEMVHEDNLDHNTFAASHTSMSSQAVKPDALKPDQQQSPPIEISDAGSPLSSLSPSPPTKVGRVAPKPIKAPQTVAKPGPPEPVPGLMFIEKSTLHGSLLPTILGPANLFNDIAQPVCFSSLNQSKLLNHPCR